MSIALNKERPLPETSGVQLIHESGGATSAAAGKGTPQLLKKQLNTADAEFTHYSI